MGGAEAAPKKNLLLMVSDLNFVVLLLVPVVPLGRAFGLVV